MEAAAEKAFKVGLLVFPQMQVLDFAGPYDTFAAAGYDVCCVGVNSGSVAVDGSIHIACEYDLQTCPPLDLFVVPGGTGITELIGRPDCLEFLNRMSRHTTYLASVCTGALLLGAAGLLEGYDATTHWRYLDLLERCGARPQRARVVHDRDRITGGGVTAGIDFGLEVIAILSSPALAKLAQLAVEYNPQPPFSGDPMRADRETITRYEEGTIASYEARAKALAAARIGSPLRPPG